MLAWSYNMLKSAGRASMNFVDLTADNDEDDEASSPTRREAQTRLAVESAQQELSQTWLARKRPSNGIKVEKLNAAEATNANRKLQNLLAQVPPVNKRKRKRRLRAIRKLRSQLELHQLNRVPEVERETLSPAVAEEEQIISTTTSEYVPLRTTISESIPLPTTAAAPSFTPPFTKVEDIPLLSFESYDDTTSSRSVRRSVEITQLGPARTQLIVNRPLAESSKLHETSGDYPDGVAQLLPDQQINHKRDRPISISSSSSEKGPTIASARPVPIGRRSQTSTLFKRRKIVIDDDEDVMPSLQGSVTTRDLTTGRFKKSITPRASTSIGKLEAAPRQAPNVKGPLPSSSIKGNLRKTSTPLRSSSFIELLDTQTPPCEPSSTISYSDGKPRKPTTNNSSKCPEPPVNDIPHTARNNLTGLNTSPSRPTQSEPQSPPSPIPVPRTISRGMDWPHFKTADLTIAKRAALGPRPSGVLSIPTLSLRSQYPAHPLVATPPSTAAFSNTLSDTAPLKLQSVPDKATGTPKQNQSFEQRTKYLAAQLARSNPGMGMYSAEEDALLIHLAEVVELSWTDIHQRYFPHRTTRETIYCRWYKKLKNRPTGSQASITESKKATRPRRLDSHLGVAMTPDLMSISDEDLISDSNVRADSRILSRRLGANGVRQVVSAADTLTSSTRRRTLMKDEHPKPVIRANISNLYVRAADNFRPMQSQNIRYTTHTSLGPCLSFTGTSGDVNSVAWAPNGRYFAAGSAALTDSHSMQYNVPNNLLLGDLDLKRLKELPAHFIPRPRTDTGTNSSWAMFNSQDPNLFTTVSTVRFSSDSQIMFSAGYDNVARMWDVRKGISKAKWLHGWRHKEPIDLLELNGTGLFATGAQRPDGSCIKVMRYGLDLSQKDLLPIISFSSHRGKKEKNSQIVPASMKWGPTTHGQEKYLLVGFSANAQDFGAGETLFWNLETQQEVANFNTRNVFDVAWSPSIFGRFAIGCTAGHSVNRGTKSVVRLHDSRLTGAGLKINAMNTIELECPALDMNDVLFNQFDDNLVSVGCTDGVTYVWDLRYPDVILHQLSHGGALLELDVLQDRERVDTGVRFVSWGQTGRQLFTGSSDGVVSSWNPYLSPEDVHVEDVTQLKSGVMTGAFSPDFSNLLLGEVNGTVSVLSVGSEISDNLVLERADHESTTTQKKEISGIEEGNKLVQSRQIEIRLFGDLGRQAVQGPNYDYTGFIDQADDAPELREAADRMQQSFRLPDSPCKLHHHIPIITEEEQGDNGASRDRIPASVRYAPRLDKPALFLECFRCQKPLQTVEVDAAVEEVLCHGCNLAWRVDILGFTAKIRRLDWFFRPDPADDDEQVTMETHYNSLWEDRPPSPL